MLLVAGTSIRPTLSDMSSPGSAESRGWQPTTDEMIASIAKTSAGRRADCLAFVVEFVEEYAADRTREQLDLRWVGFVKKYPWYAEDLLYCLDAALRNAGRPIPDQICDIAQVEADGGEVVREMSEEQWQELGRRWLEELRARFRPVFEELSRS